MKNLVFICVFALLTGCYDATDTNNTSSNLPSNTSQTESPATSKQTNDKILVNMTTSSGLIQLELFKDKAPVTVNNFLNYIKDRFYDNTIFHRVIPGFMIQGGGMTVNLVRKPTRPAIKNESYNKVSNARGTIAMARTSDPNSATAQFFINVVDNTFLDRSKNNAGYAVFGRVVSGMDVVDKIAGTKTGTKGYMQNVPNIPVLIMKVEVVEQEN